MTPHLSRMASNIPVGSDGHLGTRPEQDAGLALTPPKNPTSAGLGVRGKDEAQGPAKAPGLGRPPRRGRARFARAQEAGVSAQPTSRGSPRVSLTSPAPDLGPPRCLPLPSGGTGPRHCSHVCTRAVHLPAERAVSLTYATGWAWGRWGWNPPPPHPPCQKERKMTALMVRNLRTGSKGCRSSLVAK